MPAAGDDLAAAKDGAIKAGDRYDRVAQIHQIGDGRARHALFQGNCPFRLPVHQVEARAVQGRLRIEAVVSQGEHDLHVPLGLHEAAHDAEGGEERAVILVGDQGRDDGVVRPFARRQARWDALPAA